jgi:hypothetical protein
MKGRFVKNLLKNNFLTILPFKMKGPAPIQLSSTGEEPFPILDLNPKMRFKAL